MTLPKILKKYRFFFLLGISLGLILISFTQAKAYVSTSPLPAPDEGEVGEPLPSYKFEIWEPAVYQSTEMNQQSFSNETVYAVSASITDQILGCKNCPPQQQQQGAVHGLGRLIAGMYANPPASSFEYLAYLSRSIGLAKPAYAQGVGFEGLTPILEIWKAFRNIAYLFFVIIFIFIGFAIMFRLKIDPQTVITIQNALPRLVIALILVTFSYAIAGLMIDLIYVIISLLFTLLGDHLVGDITDVEGLLGENVFTAAIKMLSDEPFSFVTAPGSQIYEIVSGFFDNFPIISNIVGTAAGGLATLVFAIAVAFSLFKLFFTLLISYVSIIIGVIFAPLMLMLEAVPGQKGLGNWLKMMLSNIVPFPMVAAIFMLGGAITDGFQTAPQGEGWVAPFLGAGWGASYLGPLIGLGIVLLAPSLVDSTKKAIGAPGIGAGVMAPITGAVGVVAAPFRATYGYTVAPMFEEARRVRGRRMAFHMPRWMGGQQPPQEGS